jgi:large subunit ribosomal protein L30
MSPARAKSAETAGHVRVTQVRSSISTKPKHRGTLRALGLRGIGRSRVLPDVPDVRGMIARVPHLVEVVPATAEEAAAQRQHQEVARRARRASERPTSEKPTAEKPTSGKKGGS